MFAKRLLKDNTSNDIDGISRRDVEKLVYQKRVQIMMNYIRYQHKGETYKLLIEMLYKFY
jgi:hypothetical protein